MLLLLSPAAFMVLGWFTDAYRDTAAASEVSHRLHEIVFGILFSLALVGAVSLLFSAKRSVGGLIQLTVPLLTLSIIVTSTVAWDFGLLLYLTPLAAVLLFARPSRPYRSGPIWWWAAALVVIAAFPFRVEIDGLVARAMSGAQNHTTHWSAMAAFVLVLIFLGGVVALRVSGYRVVALSIAGAAAVYGAASLVFPYDASSHRPGYAVGLMVWAAAWFLGVRYLDHPHRAKRHSTVARVVGRGFLLLAVPLISVIWVTTDSQPNVPHRPDPNRPELMAADVDRATCLECHASSTVGAPIPPHSFDQACEGELCWGGRSDCAGCHRLDPNLGGPTEQIELSGWVSLAVQAPPSRGINPLAAEDLALIDALEALE